MPVQYHWPLSTSPSSLPQVQLYCADNLRSTPYMDKVTLLIIISAGLGHECSLQWRIDSMCSPFWNMTRYPKYSVWYIMYLRVSCGTSTDRRIKKKKKKTLDQLIMQGSISRGKRVIRTTLWLRLRISWFVWSDESWEMHGERLWLEERLQNICNMHAIKEHLGLGWKCNEQVIVIERQRKCLIISYYQVHGSRVAWVHDSPYIYWIPTVSLQWIHDSQLLSFICWKCLSDRILYFEPTTVCD